MEIEKLIETFLIIFANKVIKIYLKEKEIEISNISKITARISGYIRISNSRTSIYSGFDYANYNISVFENHCVDRKYSKFNEFLDLLNSNIEFHNKLKYILEKEILL